MSFIESTAVNPVSILYAIRTTADDNRIATRKMKEEDVSKPNNNNNDGEMISGMQYDG